MNPITLELNPWRSIAGLRDIQRELSQLFGAGLSADRRKPFPMVNLSSDQNGALITAELPGVDPAALHITIQKGQLTLKGTIHDTPPDGEGVVCQRKERSSGEFARTITLPFEVEEAKVVAKYDQGVLAITLPRVETAIPRTIPVIAN